jgi:phosphatidylglycerophosphate synthase
VPGQLTAAPPVVKATDGLFTTFFVSPLSVHVARACARAGIRPNPVTVFSMLLGVAAAAAFATGERPGYVAGAAIAYLAFFFDCVDGQLARLTGAFSALGAYLDSIFDRAKEYVLYAGLAIGAGTDTDWVLACAALALQTTRHAVDFSGAPPTRRAQPGPLGPLGWLKRTLTFPIGERFAVIALVTALATPRATFVVLLAWGGFALAYVAAGRLLRGTGRRTWLEPAAVRAVELTAVAVAAAVAGIPAAGYAVLAALAAFHYHRLFTRKDAG